MALINDKTWLLSKNNTVTGDVTQTGGSDDLTNGWKQFWIDVKDQMVTFGWTVEGSSDATTGVMDSVDRWTTIADLEAADVSGGALAHSWIVLKQPGTLKYMLFSHGHKSSGTLPAKRMVLSLSRNNYTGGSNTVDPTAVDEGNLKDGTGFLTNSWIEPDGGNKNMVWHMWHSTDGKNTRVAIYTSSQLQGVWMFEELKGPQTNWSPSWMDGMGAANGATVANVILHYWDFAENFYRSYHRDIPPLRAVWETFGFDFNSGSITTSMYALAVNAAGPSGEIKVFPYTIWVDEFGRFSRLGDVYDMWAEGIQADGTGYPATPGLHVHVGDHWVWPWDGTAYNIV